MSSASGPSATTTTGEKRTSDSKTSYVMDKFLTEVGSSAEKLACTKSKDKPSEDSLFKGTEATAQYLDQWQSLWDAMGGVRPS